MVFVLGPLLILLPLACLVFPNGSRVTLASGLAHSVGALLLNFGISASIYAYGAGRTIIDPMTYLMLKLELLSRAIVLALVFAFVWLVSVAFRNYRTHAR
jgi:hypothetical protein